MSAILPWALCFQKNKTGKKCFASKAEHKFCVRLKERLAIVNFVKQFRHYLYRKPFLFRTDHCVLRWLLNKEDSEGQLARWIEKLSTYEFKIQYRLGKMHKTNSKFNIDLGKCTQMQML